MPALHQTDQLVADNKIICPCDFGQFAVSHVDHFTDHADVAVGFVSDLAKVEQRDQRPCIGDLCCQIIAIAQNEHMIVSRDVQALKR